MAKYFVQCFQMSHRKLIFFFHIHLWVFTFGFSTHRLHLLFMLFKYFICFIELHQLCVFSNRYSHSNHSKRYQFCLSDQLKAILYVFVAYKQSLLLYAIYNHIHLQLAVVPVNANFHIVRKLHSIAFKMNHIACDAIQSISRVLLILPLPPLLRRIVENRVDRSTHALVKCCCCFVLLEHTTESNNLSKYAKYLIMITRFIVSQHK